MRITGLVVDLFSWGGVPAVKYGAHSFERAGKDPILGLVTVSTDAGIEGHAFLGSSSRGADLDAASLGFALKPVLMGQDPLDRERLYQGMARRHKATTLRAIGAVDVALWDLAGKAANLPVHKLIGGFRDSIRAYASSPVHRRIEDYIEEAQAIRAKGWAGYKIHPPSGWQADIETCRRVREAVGEEFTLMLDATWSYEYTEALRVGRAIEELGFYWYEDPLLEDDIYNYVKLKQQLHIPLMATEYSSGGFGGYAAWISAQATDYLRGDVAAKGGITACLKAAHLAEAFGMNFEFHHGGNSLNNFANLQVICGIRNSELFEVLLPDAAQKFGVLNELEIDAQGMVSVPQTPGLGAELDFELIRRNAVGQVT